MSEKTGRDHATELPPEVLELLKSSTIGYLSVRSPKGDLYSYPVAFYYSDYRVYFMTPVSAAKLRFIRANPEVSFLVDNHLVTKDARGVMIQGGAKVLSVARTVVSILSVGPKMVKFAQKYPGMFTFYSKGKELPDERKLYKYRLIKISPRKVVFWKGYVFGKLALQGKLRGDPLAEAPDEEKMQAFAGLLGASDMTDEELVPSPTAESMTREWTGGLERAVRNGTLTEEERSAVESFRGFLRMAADVSNTGPGVTEDERRLLARWKKSGSQA
jgi:hypothetical protein